MEIVIGAMLGIGVGLLCFLLGHRVGYFEGFQEGLTSKLLEYETATPTRRLTLVWVNPDKKDEHAS